MSNTLKARSICSFCTMLVMTLAASGAKPPSAHAEFPFRYGTNGAGGSGFQDFLVEEGRETKPLECSILAASHALHIGFKDVDWSSGIVPGKHYVSDYDLLDNAAIAAYNRADAKLAIKAGPLYAATYDLVVQKKDHTLFFDIQAKLHLSGTSSGGKWFDYGGKYNDSYLGERFMTSVRAGVQTCKQSPR